MDCRTTSTFYTLVATEPTQHVRAAFCGFNEKKFRLCVFIISCTGFFYQDKSVWSHLNNQDWSVLMLSRLNSLSSTVLPPCPPTEPTTIVTWEENKWVKVARCFVTCLCYQIVFVTFPPPLSIAPHFTPLSPILHSLISLKKMSARRRRFCLHTYTVCLWWSVLTSCTAFCQSSPWLY